MKNVEEDTQKFSFIERLPIAIFPIIQSFVSWRDYRYLMNCNRLIVKDIKYETNHLHFISKKGIFNIETRTCLVEELNESLYLRFCSRVKDPSKQISIHLSLFSEYARFTQRPYKVKIDSCVDMKDLDFNVFNNIHHVSLQDCRGVERITSGFENVKILELSIFHNLNRISKINQSKTLEIFHISCCFKCLQLYFPMDNVTTLRIGDTPISRLPLLPRLKRFSFHSFVPIAGDLLEILRLPTIEFAEICAPLPETVDVSVFQNVPDLTLNESIPLFTFNGKRLVVLRSSFSSWSPSSSLKFLTKLELANYKGEIHFEPIRHLTHLRLLDCLNVTMIPTLPKLCSLTISDCPNLTTISPEQPSLHTLDIYKCSVNLPNITNRIMRSVILTSSEIKGRGSIDDHTAVRKIAYVEINGCPRFTSLSEINQQLPQSYQGIVKLRNLKDFLDFTGLCNLNVLELNNLSLLESCEGIHDVNTLKISDCKGLTSTAGLRNVKKSLLLKGCENLISLVDVGGIPHLSISECPKIEDYSPLRKHEEVRIEGMSEDKIAWLNEHQKELQIKSLLITQRNREQMGFLNTFY